MRTRTVAFLLLGYLCMGRSFAYWGIPPVHIFIGEVFLAWFLFSGPSNSAGRWPWAAMRSQELSQFTKVFVVFLALGIFEMLRGLLLGHPPLTAMRDLAFNYYPIYFFLGLWAALEDPDFLPKLLRLAGWVNGVYGILFVLALSRIPWLFPGISQEVEPVSIFGQPSFSAMILLGLLSFEKELGRVWLLLTLNAAVMLGMLIRAEWVAFATGLVLWTCFTGRIKKALLCAALVLALLGLMYVTNFTYEGPETRGRTISARDLIGQVVAPFNSSLAANFTSDAFNSELSEGTTVFRLLYWAGVWSSVHETLGRALLGHGYGYSLGGVVSELNLDVRTPHNLFFYALGYTGWIGVAIFGLFLLTIFRLQLEAYRKTHQPFGLVLWVAVLAFAFFTPFFETPQGAIPFYLLEGCSCGALLCREVRGSVPAAFTFELRWNDSRVQGTRPNLSLAAD